MSAFVLGPLVGNVQAQSNGLGVRPKIDITIKQGETVEETAFIRNPSNEEPLTINISMVDFEAKDETGAPNFLLNDTRSTASAQDFIQIDQQATIEPGKSLSLPFTITVPADQGAGTYYSAIRYSTVTNAQDNQIGISAANTTLVFVRVPGDAKELVKLEKFGAYQVTGEDRQGHYRSLFTKTRPESLAFTIKNEGNVAEMVKGSILVKNLFGNEVATISDINIRRELALRNQTRRVGLCIKEQTNNEGTPNGVCEQVIKWPGRYSAQMSMFYGENGSESREITAKASFWYLPVWFMITFGILTALIVLGIVLAIFRIRRNLGYGGRRR